MWESKSLTVTPKLFYIVYSMFDEPNDLSPDLVWMMRSDQVDEASIAEALARQYYQRIFYLALSCLIYPGAAHKAAQDTLVQAGIKSNTFQGDGDIYSWLVDIANQICQARKKYQIAQKFLNPRLIDSFKKRDFTARLTPHQIESAIKKIRHQIQGQRQIQKKHARYREFILLGVAMVIAFIIFRITAIITTPSTGSEDNGETILIQELIDTFQDDGLIEPGAERIVEPQQSKHGIAPQDPLTIDSTHEDIWRRMLLSRYLWDNMWVDIRFILNGPQEYAGPQIAERHQLWIDQETGGLHLSGPLNSSPDDIERITPHEYTPRPPTFSLDDFARMGSQLPWLYLSADMILTPYMVNLFFIGDSNFPPSRLQYRVIDKGQWAGRPAVIVDVIDQNGRIQTRLWLDSSTGIILRELFLGYESVNQILMEISITKIKFDVEFPAEFIQRRNISIIEGGYVIDFNGNPEISGESAGIKPLPSLMDQINLPVELPPPDFDFSASRLSFASGHTSKGTEHGSTAIHVFADNYYLGDIEIGDLFRTLCIRSAMGDKIAVSQWSQTPSGDLRGVQIYNLINLEQIEYSIPDSDVRYLSFSPDDRYVVTSKIEEYNFGQSTSLIVIDTLTDDSKHIPGINNSLSLAWSPDGTQIASLHWPSFRNFTKLVLHVFVYDLQTGEINSVLIDSNIPQGKTELIVPLRDWDAKFSLPLGGFEPCVDPPN